jgi:hypothetical protein
MQTGYTETPFETGAGAQQWGQQFRGQHSPGEAALEFIQHYSRERPEVVAMWAFGIGFVLGWKLKPW